MRKGLGVVCAVTAFALPAAPAPAAQFLALPTQSIITTDPTQAGRLADADPPGTCAAPVTTGTLDADTTPRHIDSYVLTNQTEQAQCVEVSLDPQVSCAGQVQSAAYVPTFGTDITLNLAGDIGAPPAMASTPKPYSFSVPAGSRFVVVVNEVAANTGCAGYGVTMSSILPWVTTTPEITGGAVTGETLSASFTWAATPPPTIVRQWQRCDGAGANCADIAGATATTYVPTDADLGHVLRVVETANDAGGTSSAAATTVPVQSGRPRPAYARTTSSSTLERGDTLVPGSQGDDELADFALPFPVSFYGTEYTTARLGTNGVVQFDSSNPTPLNAPLPTTRFGPTIAAHWDDLVTAAPGEGIFTSVTGSAPDRILHIEWRANLFPAGGTDSVNFEVRLRENSPTVSLVYGVVTNSGASATAGLQAAPASPFGDGFPFALPGGLQIDYTSSRPAIGGEAREGHALTASNATWVGPGTITTAFQWLDCDAGGDGCGEIAGATGATLTPTAAHVGRRLRLRATATNERGSTALLSAPTEAVAAAAPATPPTATPDKTAPVISSLTMTNRRFRVARGLTPISAAAKRGTNFRSSVSEAGTARYTIQRGLRGRQVGKRCVKPTRKLRKSKRCTRYRTVQTFTRPVKQGANSFFFTGRVGSLALAPNSYRVVMRVKDAAGNELGNRWARFRIVAR